MSDPYVPRLVDTEIEERLKSNGAVRIEGVKHCGKTRTSAMHSASVCFTGSLSHNPAAPVDTDDSTDNTLFGDNPCLIDEWQSFPSVWGAVERILDKTSSKGLFILCGSALPDGCTDFGNGCLGTIPTLHMRTMSLFESSDSDGSVSLSALFRNEPVVGSPNKSTLRKLSDLIVRGGWPGTIAASTAGGKTAVSGFLYELYENLFEAVNSRSSSKSILLLRALARNESTTISASALSRDIREHDGGVMKPTTIQKYLAVFDRMFLTENQPAYVPDLRPAFRIVKTPKRHLADPSLAAAALGLDSRDLMNDVRVFDPFFEALCERDLQIYATAIGGRLLHFKDVKGRKIDAIVELPDGRWGAFEIESASNRVDVAAKNLSRVSALISGDPNGREPEFLCVLCGILPAPYRREDGVYVVPICSLGP